jgi:hypothetical protein
MQAYLRWIQQTRWHRMLRNLPQMAHTFTSGCLGNATQDFGVWSLESAALPQFAFGLETAPRRAAG